MSTRHSPPCRLEGKGDRYYSRTYDRASGRRSWVSCGTDNLKAAREWVRSQEVEDALGPTRRAAEDAAGKTFTAALESYLEEKKIKVGAVAYGVLRSRADAFWLPVFGRRLLTEVTPEDISAYAHKRRKGLLRRPAPAGGGAPIGHRKRPPLRPIRPIAAATANGDLQGLASVFRYAIDRGWIDRTPMRGAQRFSGEMKRRIRSLTPAERDQLLSSCRDGGKVEVTALRNLAGPRAGRKSNEKTTWTQSTPPPEYLYPLVLTAAWCGFRRGTLLRLRWEHLDLDRAAWSIPAELMKVPRDYAAPVPRIVVEEIRAYRARLLEKHGPERVTPGATIFGLPAVANMRRSFHAAAKRAGLPNLSIHDLRRNFLNQLRRAGVSLENAMALSAHKSIQTVLNHYREVDQGELAEAVRLLEGREKGGPGEKAQG